MFRAWVFILAHDLAAFHECYGLNVCARMCFFVVSHSTSRGQYLSAVVVAFLLLFFVGQNDMKVFSTKRIRQSCFYRHVNMYL